MGRENRGIGRRGEDAAAEFLRRRGYAIVGRNARTVFGEIDIVARRGKLPVFVEVKTRATSSLGPPLLSVTAAKQRHLVKSALAYLKRHGLADGDWRIDVVSVKLNESLEAESIELIENAVEDNGW